MQAGINCGPSSQSDFIQNYFLLKRMFRFSLVFILKNSPEALHQYLIYTTLSNKL